MHVMEGCQMVVLRPMLIMFHEFACEMAYLCIFIDSSAAAPIFQCVEPNPGTLPFNRGGKRQQADTQFRAARSNER